MSQFQPTNNAVASVMQVCLGAKFNAIKYDPWKDGKSSVDHLLIIGPFGEVIGEADNYIYGSRGYSLHLCDGSYSGFVDASQINILQA